MMNVNKIYLTADKVLIKCDGSEEIRGGIYIPDKHQRPPITGIVVKVGPGIEYEKGKIRDMAVKKGDKVLIPFDYHVKVMINDEEFRIYNESDILGIIDD